MWKRSLNAFGDPLAPTADQMKYEDKNTSGGGAYAILRMNFDQLTSVQQDALKEYSEAMHRQAADQPQRGSAGIDFERPIEINVIPSVQLLIPGLDGPVDTDLGQWVSDMFHDMSRWKNSRTAPKPARPQTPTEDLPSLADLTAGIPRRALLTNCRTSDDVTSAIAKMKTMGLNQLWLVVFSNGAARIPGTSFSTGPADAPDLLALALKLTKGTGIDVYPVLDIFRWSDNVPADLVDLTITGRNSQQDDDIRRKHAALLAAAQGNDPPALPSRRLIVSAFSPVVVSRLAALVKTLSNRPGVAGVVWRETDPEGYDGLADRARYSIHTELGYTEPARLAFLRASHADPIDLFEGERARGLEQRANTHLPQFDDYDLSAALNKEWLRFRAQTNVEVMNTLFQAALPSGEAALAQNVNRAPNGQKIGQVETGQKGQKADLQKPSVFVRDRRESWGTTWYGLWGGPDTPLPTRHYDSEATRPGEDPQEAPPEDKQARSQSRIIMLRLPFTGGLDEISLVKQWQSALKDLRKNKKWDGFVLELQEP